MYRKIKMFGVIVFFVYLCTPIADVIGVYEEK